MSVPTALTFRTLKEATPGRKLKKVFTRYWPGYRKWFLTEGDSVPVTGRRVGLHCIVPPHSSSPVHKPAGHEVKRPSSEHDYSPRLCDGLVSWSNRHGTRVMGLSDCVWGVLDGLNEHGLAVSLAFGGRKVVGHGFGVTLIRRRSRTPPTRDRSSHLGVGAWNQFGQGCLDDIEGFLDLIVRCRDRHQKPHDVGQCSARQQDQTTFGATGE